MRWRARGPVAEPLGVRAPPGWLAEVGAAPGDCIFFAAGPRALAQSLLGAARLEIGRRLGLIDESAWAFCWVVDAPLFEPRMSPWPRAMSHRSWRLDRRTPCLYGPQDLETFDSDPGSALAYAYDIVGNGNEIGGGSIRIHRGHPGAGVRGHGFRLGGGAGAVRLPARCVQCSRPHMAGSPWVGSDLRPLVRN